MILAGGQVLRAPALAVLAAAAVACAAPVQEGCLPVAPERMPDGTEMRPPVGRSVDGAADVYIWESGDFYLVQRIFEAGAEGEQVCPPGQLAGATGCLPTDAFAVRGMPAVFGATGTDGRSWFVAWASGECHYETLFGRLAEPEARAYAAGY